MERKPKSFKRIYISGVVAESIVWFLWRVALLLWSSDVLYKVGICFGILMILVTSFGLFISQHIQSQQGL